MSKFEELNIQCSMFNIQCSFKRVFLVAGCWLLVAGSFAQTVGQKLQKAFAAFEKDPQLKHAISSLYVIDANSGQIVFNKNSQIGLAPASTQKIITSVTAFELLGKDYKYKTELGYDGKIENGRLDGQFIIKGNGDPTFGSWRYSTTKDTFVFREFSKAIIELGIKGFGAIDIDESGYSVQNIPDGWIWQDIGNYYGAGASAMNWRENQFDLTLNSDDKVGGDVRIVSTQPNYLKDYSFYNLLKSAEKGTGDNAYIYFQNGYYLVTGTIPRGESEFKISGTMINPSENFKYEFIGELLKNRIRSEWNIESFRYRDAMPKKETYKYTLITTHYSPTLDSIIYWFNKKSVNLYGEALIKTFAYEKFGFGSTDSGVAIVKKFWKEKRLDDDELNIVDGSGLSPLNRVTTHAQVEILKYAKTKSWFPSFFNSLPEYNGMKIKSGTIRGVKGFCGYHKAKNGKEYIFSFLINNYNGSASAVVNKMYKVLDQLK